MELFEAGHKIKYFDVRRVPMGVILLGGADDDVDDIGETAATAAAFFHGVIDFGRYDQLPTVLIEESGDRLFDVFDRDEIAAADQHVSLPIIRNPLNSLF
jgi:hypothetical protein